MHQAVEGKVITERPKATNHTNRTIGQKRLMAEGLTGMRVAEMKLDVRNGNS